MCVCWKMCCLSSAFKIYLVFSLQILFVYKRTSDGCCVPIYFKFIVDKDSAASETFWNWKKEIFCLKLLLLQSLFDLCVCVYFFFKENLPRKCSLWYFCHTFWNFVLIFNFILGLFSILGFRFYNFFQHPLTCKRTQTTATIIVRNKNHWWNSVETHILVPRQEMHKLRP